MTITHAFGLFLGLVLVLSLSLSTPAPSSRLSPVLGSGPFSALTSIAGDDGFSSSCFEGGVDSDSDLTLVVAAGSS